MSCLCNSKNIMEDEEQLRSKAVEAHADLQVKQAKLNLVVSTRGRVFPRWIRGKSHSLQVGLRVRPHFLPVCCHRLLFGCLRQALCGEKLQFHYSTVYCVLPAGQFRRGCIIVLLSTCIICVQFPHTTDPSCCLRQAFEYARNKVGDVTELFDVLAGKLRPDRQIPEGANDIGGTSLSTKSVLRAHYNGSAEDTVLGMANLKRIQTFLDEPQKHLGQVMGSDGRCDTRMCVVCLARIHVTCRGCFRGYRDGSVFQPKI